MDCPEEPPSGDITNNVDDPVKSVSHVRCIMHPQEEARDNLYRKDQPQNSPEISSNRNIAGKGDTD